MLQYHNTSLNIWKWSNTKSHKWHGILICTTITTTTTTTTTTATATTTTTTTTTHEFRGQRSSIPFLSTPSCLAAPWCLTSSYRFCLKIRDHGIVWSLVLESNFIYPKRKKVIIQWELFVVGESTKNQILYKYQKMHTNWYILLWNQKWAKSYLHPWKRRPTNWKTKALKIRLQGIKVGGRKRFEKSCCLKSHLGYFLSFTGRLSRLGASFLKEPMLPK